MKVYELIQKLVECEPDDEVRVNFVLDRTLDCPECENYFDEELSDDRVNIDNTDYNGRLGEFYINIKD